ncbi:MAG: galactokinase [Bacillota bacterium]
MTRIFPTPLAARLFRDSFGTAPVVAASAPGRVNLIGEHTDYNGGPVLPVALERRTSVVAGPSDRWEMVSTVDGEVHTVLIEDSLPHEWTGYLIGVARELRAVGAAPAGARIAVASAVPIGAGLSSSAALTVATARALSALAGRRLDAATLVDVASKAEHEQVGVRGGRMDQTIAVYGKRGTALLFETGSGRLTRVPMPGRIWLIETGVSHKLTGGALNERRRECEAALTVLQRRWPGLGFVAEVPMAELPEAERLLEEPLARRVRHVVTETARVHEAVRALGAGDLPRLGALLVAGHASLRDEYESSCGEADFIVDSAMRRGAHGARLTGAGWGGAVLMLAPEDRERAVVRGIRRDFAERFGSAPVAWPTRAAAGVRRDAIPD